MESTVGLGHLEAARLPGLVPQLQGPQEYEFHMAGGALKINVESWRFGCRNKEKAIMRYKRKWFVWNLVIGSDLRRSSGGFE